MDFTTLYLAYSTINEAGSLGAIAGVCLTENDAKLCAQGKGWYDTEGRVLEVSAILIGETYFVLHNVHKDYPQGISISDITKIKDDAQDKLKKSALAKLSDLEKQALGLI